MKNSAIWIRRRIFRLLSLCFTNSAYKVIITAISYGYTNTGNKPATLSPIWSPFHYDKHVLTSFSHYLIQHCRSVHRYYNQRRFISRRVILPRSRTATQYPLQHCHRDSDKAYVRIRPDSVRCRTPKLENE